MEFFSSIISIIEKTKIPEQIDKVDAVGLFTNPWFLIPFIGMIGWMFYKAAFRDIAIVVILIAVWVVSGTEYASTATVNGEIQIGKILPLVFGGAVALAVVAYLLLGKK